MLLKKYHQYHIWRKKKKGKRINNLEFTPCTKSVGPLSSSRHCELMDSMCHSLLAADSLLQVSGVKIKKEVGKHEPLIEILPESQKLFQALDM